MINACYFLLTDEVQPTLVLEKETTANLPSNDEKVDQSAGEEANSTRENGEVQSKDIGEAKSDRSADRPLPNDDKPSKSRSFLFFYQFLVCAYCFFQKVFI